MCAWSHLFLSYHEFENPYWVQNSTVNEVRDLEDFIVTGSKQQVPKVEWFVTDELKMKRDFKLHGKLNLSEYKLFKSTAM